MNEEADPPIITNTDVQNDEPTAGMHDDSGTSMASSEAEGSVVARETTLSFDTQLYTSGSTDGHELSHTSPPALAAPCTHSTPIPTNRGSMLPWCAYKGAGGCSSSDSDTRPGEFVMRLLFTEFTVQAERKMEAVMAEPLEKPLNKTLQRGEDPQLDQMLSAFGSVAEHCLPSLLRALFAWLERQMQDSLQLSEQAKKPHQDQKNKSIIHMVSGSGAGPEPPERTTEELQAERRDLAVEFLFCLALIEVLKQLPFHPGHEDLVTYIENVAFKRFNYKEGLQSNPNAANIHIIADLYAEVIGVLAHSRFSSVKKKFTAELKELKSREPSTHTTQSIISLLMGMKFFRVKMVPIEEFEASFQFLQECAQYFLEAKDKDIRHALAGLFVEILVPVAASVKNEVNVPCLKNFVDMLYSHTLDASTKSKHRLALFPLVTCLLCVSQKSFFLTNWHYFLAMCLSALKNRDPKMCRVALESLYRLLWVYMIRIKCESNSATQSRLHSIVNSLFPKGSKGVVPRDTPLNIFVKIIQFIAQERLDFAMREIVFDLLMVNRTIKVINIAPERMSIGLRAFLVVADSLQQKEGEPPMPRTSGTLPSGNTLRVKKIFLNKMLTDETARSIGMSAYFPHVRRVLVDILRALDAHCGRPLMLTNSQNASKEQEINTGDRKPKIDLFRTCVAAIPRLIPEGMSPSELVEMLCRLTVHMDEELRGLSFQSLQILMVDFPEWRQDVLSGFTQFLAREVQDTSPQLVENGLRMLLQLVSSWKCGEAAGASSGGGGGCGGGGGPATVVRGAEALALVMLCQCKAYPRRLAVHIIRETRSLLERLGACGEEPSLSEAADACVAECAGGDRVGGLLPPAERAALVALGTPDLLWLAERTHPVWTNGVPHDEGAVGPDPWEVVLVGVLGGLPAKCPTTVALAWPMLHARVHALYSVIEPAPVHDNRASLLSRSPALPRKPEREKDGSLQVWRYYTTMAYLLVPPVPSPVMRCASPDLSLSSSPDSLSGERSGGERGGGAAPGSLHKLAVPLARCEVPEVRDAAVCAMGHINPDALKDLMEEILPLVREAIDRKQENMRRRKRRDALRLHLNRLLLIIARRKTFAHSPFALEGGSLHPALVEYLDGARLCLELETERDASRELRITFADFVTELIKSFPLDVFGNLLKKDLRKSLFVLFSGWCGPIGQHLGSLVPVVPPELHERTNLAALQAMSALVCCGPCFSPTALAEEGPLYPWLSHMLSSSCERVSRLARETIVLLLECNPDVGPLLDWTVDKCFTGPPDVADGCFMALATIFSTREYPCDHYTAIINVTLMCTGSPRAPVHDAALQLLQLLDKRFFGSLGPLPDDECGNEVEVGARAREDGLLCPTYCRSQLYLSRQLSQLHPELTMPMFSEITGRFQSARTEVRQLLLQYLQPWLHNIELVDPNVPPLNPLSYMQYYSSEAGRGGRREGLGSAEATEMVLNNLFYMTAKFSDYHPKEIEELWATLCSCWPNNLKVIIRYLVIVSGMAPNDLLPYAKRVVVYLARSRPERLLDEMMMELQTVETLNCLIERTETPPFYRLTSMRKATSGHSDGPGAGAHEAGGRSGELAPVEKGTIHTKRHSGEDPAKLGQKSGELRSCDKRASAPPGVSGSVPPSVAHNVAPSVPHSIPQSEPPCPTPPPEEDPPATIDEDLTPTGACPDSTPSSGTCVSPSGDPPAPAAPRPLPMPEFGGYFAPLTEFLPDCGQPMAGFHRCNVAVMLLCDVVLDGADLDWAVHVPLMLHIVFLGMDHSRCIVHQHCRQLLQNLLVSVAAHHDPLTVARVLLAARATPVSPPTLPLTPHNFTEPDPVTDGHPSKVTQPARGRTSEHHLTPEAEFPSLPVIVTEQSPPPAPPGEVPPAPPALPAHTPLADLVKSLIHFLAARPPHQPLWNLEDITAKVWSVRSCQQMGELLRHVLRIFEESLPHAHVSQRWAQTALQLGLSCPSRHYAGRSLQVFRSVGVAMTGRMVTDILSRLVETVAEQGEDMQGYVTELLLTLEAAVDSLESNFRPLDYIRDIFKSTPNLNNKDAGHASPAGAFVPGKRSPGVCVGCVTNHTRSTSYSVSYCMRKSTTPSGPHSETKSYEGRCRSSTEAGKSAHCSNLCRSRSAQSLKLLGDSSTQDDKLTILATLFWVGASLLESDYEHEYLLGIRLLSRVMLRLPLDRPDARERLDRTQAQGSPSLHTLLLKGCTHPGTYEPAAGVLADVIPLLELPVVDPTQAVAFPMTVVALLPYMLLHYEDANQLCVKAARHIAHFTSEKSKKLENLGTVMTLYSRRTFSKESFQWTKCVVKYLWDTYSHLSLQMLAFLLEVLDKGSASLQLPVLSILHCMLYYVDLTSASAQPVTHDLLRTVAKFIDGGANYKEAMKILKLIVTRCSTLVVPPSWDAPSLLDAELHGKKELPGRTMEFTFDLSQTPVIGRKYVTKGSACSSQPPTGPSSLSTASPGIFDKATVCQSPVVGLSYVQSSPHSPHRSLSPADVSGWKRPWMSQGRVRECLVNLLTTCGQRVGLPKSPSVIFSQSSELLERESSLTSSLEEASGTPGNEPAQPPDHFGVFKDFDFLEYESESIEGESSDNFNWGVRRLILDEPGGSPPQAHNVRPIIMLRHREREESSDEEVFEGGPPVSDVPARTRGHSYSSASSNEPEGERAELTTPVPMAGPVSRDPYRNNVSTLMKGFAELAPLETIQGMHAVLKELTSRTVSVCSEVGAAGPELAALVDRFTSEDPPLAWVGGDAARDPRLLQAVRYSYMEIVEHLDTYFDRRDCLIEMYETVRSSQEDVGRCVYRLLFQMLLLVESYNKMLVNVFRLAKELKAEDVSEQMMSMRESLQQAVQQAAQQAAQQAKPEEVSPDLPTDDASLCQLLAQQRYGTAVQAFRSRAGAGDDEVTDLMNLFGRHQLNHNVVGMSRPPTEVCHHLAVMESLYKMLQTIKRTETP